MNVSFAKHNKVGSYGAVNFENVGFDNMVYDGNKNQITPNSSNGHDTGVKSLDVLNVKYVVREWVGSWWKGACFRRVREKVVLDDISLRLKSGEITAILGNSGKNEDKGSLPSAFCSLLRLIKHLFLSG